MFFRAATLRRLGPAAPITGHFDRASRVRVVLPLFEPKANLYVANWPHIATPGMAASGRRQLSAAAGTEPLVLYGGDGGGEARPSGADAGTAGPKEAQRHKNISIASLRAKHRKGVPISMITAYDYPSAQAADAAGVDMVLVGDSLGMVVLGYDSTTPVSMAEMLHHCKAVARGTSRPFLVGDLPFGSYLTPQEAVQNACRLVKEGGMDGVKLEGGASVAAQAEAIVAAGINVMGHIGLTPQTAASLGGYRVQGKSAAAAQQLLDDALALQSAGCHAVVLECVPDRVAEHCTRLLDVPTIGIGAGPHVSGQVQVLHDAMGLYDKMRPKFSRQYREGGTAMRQALAEYVNDVTNSAFPSAAESFTMADDEHAYFLQSLQPRHRPRVNGAAEVEQLGQEGKVMEEIRELRRSLKMRLEMLESIADDLATTKQPSDATNEASEKTKARANVIKSSSQTVHEGAALSMRQV